MLVFKSIHNSMRIADGATRSVDQVCALLHLANEVCIEHTSGTKHNKVHEQREVSAPAYLQDIIPNMMCVITGMRESVYVCSMQPTVSTCK